MLKALLRPLVLGLAVLSASLNGSPTVAQTSPLPALPNIPDISCAAPTGIAWNILAGGDLQAALNSALPGDLITLAAGAAFTGPFTLPNKPVGPCITIRTSAPDSALPPAGARITPAYASVLPKIVSPGGNIPALQTAPGAHHFQFVGVEFAQANDGALLNTLVVLGDAYNTDPTQTPHHLVLDRVYIHGLPTSNVKHCVELQTASTSIINSHISDCKAVGYDAQALVGWNGPGPFKIVNNYLEGSGENVMFGGADPRILNLVPSDIEIRQNYFNKPLSWKTDDPSYAGIHWSVKNLFELKNAQRVLADGNLFEHVWPDGQAGFAIVFTPRNQDGTAPWSIVKDVTFTNNIVRHAGNGIQFLGTDNGYPSLVAQNFLVQNNLLDDIGGAQWGGSGQGRFTLIVDGGGGPAYLSMLHNTAFHQGSLIVADGTAPPPGFVFSNNITEVNLYGITGTGTGVGTPTLNTYLPGYVFGNNIIAGPWPSTGGAVTSQFPPSSFFPMTITDTGFADYANGNYQLAATSPYKNAGTDGKDVGVDWNALLAAQAPLPGAPPPPTDTIPPTAALTAPAAGTTVSGTITVAANATDNVGVASVQFQLDGANLGAAVTTAPYMISWNTTAAANTTHILTAIARDAADNTTTAAGVTITVSNTSSGGGSSAQNVVWTSLANVTATGNALQKTSGCDGCADAGAVSAQTIASGDGYMQFTASETATTRGIGLSNGNPGTSLTEISFAILLSSSGYASVYEKGAYQADSPYVAGDVFRVAVVSGQVRYSKNGTVFYTSAASPAYPLLVDTTLWSLNATFTNVVIAGAGSTTAPDTTPPTVALTAPTSGSAVSGMITVSANATDNVGVASVQFQLDGANLGAAVTVVPYTISWNTTTASNAAHILTAIARDAAGNTGTAAGVTVTVSNAVSFAVSPPSLSFGSVTVGTTSTQADVQVTNTGSSGAALTSVAITGPFAIAQNNCVANGTWNGVLAPGTHCDIYVVFAPALAGSALGALTINAPGGPYTVALSGNGVAPADTTPPAASITAPSVGATVSGTITVSASATDNVGVASVQFQLDGVNLGAQLTTAPYSISWNTTTAANTTHVLTAIARDAAGNTTISAGASVTVANPVPDTTPPSVSITAPANGTTLTNNTTIKVAATDNAGVNNVQVYGDSRLIGSVTCAGSLSCVGSVTWNTRRLSRGGHSISAVATDTSGNNSSTAIAVSK